MTSSGSAEADLAVGARPRLGALDEVQPLRRREEQAGDEPQPRVLRAQVEQALLGVEAEVDRRGHRVGVLGGELGGVGLVVGGPDDELGVRGAGGDAGAGVGLLGLVLEELDGRARVGLVGLALDDPKRPRAPRQDVQAPVVHALEDLGDLAGAADVAQRALGGPDDPELRVALQQLLEHRLVARLEDVQRDELVGQRDERQREQREVAHRPVGHRG